MKYLNIKKGTGCMACHAAPIGQGQGETEPQIHC